MRMLRWLMRAVVEAVSGLCWLAAVLTTAWMVAAHDVTLQRALGAGVLVVASALGQALSLAVWTPWRLKLQHTAVVTLMHALLSTGLRLAYSALGVAALVHWMRLPRDILPVAALLAGAVLCRLLYAGVDVAAEAALRARRNWFVYPWAVASLLTLPGLATLGGRWLLSTASWLMMPVALACAGAGMTAVALAAAALSLACGLLSVTVQRRHARLTAVALRKAATAG